MALDTSPFKATGASVSYAALSGGSSGTVGELKNFDFGGTDIAVIDVTKLSDLARVKIPGIPDNGDLTLSVFLVPSDSTIVQLQAWSQFPLVVGWTIVVPDDPVTTTTAGVTTVSYTTCSTITFNGFLSNFTPKGFDQDNTPMADITITISGGMKMSPGT